MQARTFFFAVFLLPQARSCWMKEKSSLTRAEYLTQSSQGLYAEMKFEKPSRVQAETLPMILRPPHANLIAQASYNYGSPFFSHSLFFFTILMPPHANLIAQASYNYGSLPFSPILSFLLS